MQIADTDDFLSALPFLVAAGGLVYLSVVALGGTALRFRRNQRKREQAAKRLDTGPTPWNDWLREINAREGQSEPHDLEGKPGR